MNVYSVVKVLGRKIPPSRGRSRERPKIKSRAKIFEDFFMRPSFRYSSADVRKQKKAQLPQWVTGPQTLMYGIKGNKLRQKDSKQNKDTEGRKLSL